MAKEKLVFDIKSEIQNTAKALVAIILLSIPFFLFLLPAPDSRKISHAADILLVATCFCSIGGIGKSDLLHQAEKIPSPDMQNKNSRIPFPLVHAPVQYHILLLCCMHYFIRFFPILYWPSQR